MMNIRKKDEDSQDGGIHQVDKSTVLQEARTFNLTPIKPRKCRSIIAKILHLIYLGESFATTEATELFFSITKLFQCPDPALRQAVYLVIKELSTMAQDVIMVTSSVTRDMNSKSDVIYRANAIRALCKITDASLLQGLERFIKQAMADSTAAVSAGALVSSYHLFFEAKDIVKRWVNEIQGTLTNKKTSAAGRTHQLFFQYHAIGLLYQIRQQDKMALIKLIQNYKNASCNQYALCLIARYAGKIAEDETNDDEVQELFGFLSNCLHKPNAVRYEAARAMCRLRDKAKPSQTVSAVNSLKSMLASSRPIDRFAGIRTLNRMAMTDPELVSECNFAIENLVTDPNRSIATYAITTLLKTGTEPSVDRLMKQITSFISEISDEFKVTVVEAIRSLCLKFPSKYSSLLTFLSTILRDEGGYNFKRAVVEAIFDIVRMVPDSKEAALGHLCEFIEDCEFSRLSVRILHLIGEEAHNTPSPTRYVRYIYNRIILENSTVRAAALSALAKIGLKHNETQKDNLRESIRTLIKGCLEDADDEVRDRAALYIKALEDQDIALNYVVNDTTFSLPALENSLVRYIQDPVGHGSPFDISLIPVLTKAQEEAERIRQKTTKLENAANGALATTATSKPTAGMEAVPGQDLQVTYGEQMAKIPQLASLGYPFKSSIKPTDLTESETEYVVQCIKHVFPEYVVFQFNCTNTIGEVVLENVKMVMMSEEPLENLHLENTIPVKSLIVDEMQSVYVVYKRPKNEYPLACFSNTLRFAVKEKDPHTGDFEEDGYEDEYMVEDIELGIGDYMLGVPVLDFQREWEASEGQPEQKETFELSLNSLQEAVTSLVDMFGMLPVEDTGRILNKTSLSHTLLLSGTFIGGAKTLCRCRMVSTGTSIKMEVLVRSTEQYVCELLMDTIA